MATAPPHTTATTTTISELTTFTTNVAQARLHLRMSGSGALIGTGAGGQTGGRNSTSLVIGTYGSSVTGSPPSPGGRTLRIDSPLNRSTAVTTTAGGGGPGGGGGGGRNRNSWTPKSTSRRLGSTNSSSSGSGANSRTTTPRRRRNSVFESNDQHHPPAPPPPNYQTPLQIVNQELAAATQSERKKPAHTYTPLQPSSPMTFPRHLHTHISSNPSLSSPVSITRKQLQPTFPGNQDGSKVPSNGPVDTDPDPLSVSSGGDSTSPPILTTRTITSRSSTASALKSITSAITVIQPPPKDSSPPPAEDVLLKQSNSTLITKITTTNDPKLVTPPSSEGETVSPVILTHFTPPTTHTNLESPTVQRFVASAYPQPSLSPHPSMSQPERSFNRTPSPSPEFFSHGGGTGTVESGLHGDTNGIGHSIMEEGQTEKGHYLQAQTASQRGSIWSCWLPKSSKPILFDGDAGIPTGDASYGSSFSSPPPSSCRCYPHFLWCTFLGVRVVGWFLILIFLALGVTEIALLWQYVANVMDDLLSVRFSAGCLDRTKQFAFELSSVFQQQTMLAEMLQLDQTQIQPDQYLNNYVTKSLTSFSYPLFTTLTYALAVNPTNRATFESTYGTIMSWNTVTHTFETAATQPNQPFGFFPVITTLEACGPKEECIYRLTNDNNITTNTGFRLPLYVDLGSIPSFVDALNELTINQQPHLISPDYIANYTSREISLCEDPCPCQQNICSSNEIEIGETLVTNESGFRMGLMTPVWKSKLDVYFTGVLISSYDLSTVLHTLLLEPQTRTNSILNSADMCMGDFVASIVTEPIINSSQLIQPSQRLYYGWRKVNETRGQGLTYTPADMSQIDSGKFSSAWPIGAYLAPNVPNLDWTFECRGDVTTHTDVGELSLQQVRVAIINVVLVSLVTILLYLLFRWYNAIDIERRVKDHSLLQMDQAILAAESARDAKTDFMAFLCHELRNPLHAVLSMADSLRETQLDADQSESVFTIHASSELMLAITNDILDLSKIEAGKVELEIVHIDLWALIHSLIRANSSQAQERGVKVIGNIDPRVPRYIQADPTRLNQIITNLMSNAIKFSHKHGEVHLEVEVDDDEDDDDPIAGGTDDPLTPRYHQTPNPTNDDISPLPAPRSLPSQQQQPIATDTVIELGPIELDQTASPAMTGMVGDKRLDIPSNASRFNSSGITGGPPSFNSEGGLLSPTFSSAMPLRGHPKSHASMEDVPIPPHTTPHRQPKSIMARRSVSSLIGGGVCIDEPLMTLSPPQPSPRLVLTTQSSHQHAIQITDFEGGPDLHPGAVHPPGSSPNTPNFPSHRTPPEDPTMKRLTRSAGLTLFPSSATHQVNHEPLNFGHAPGMLMTARGNNVVGAPGSPRNSPVWFVRGMGGGGRGGTASAIQTPLMRPLPSGSPLLSAQFLSTRRPTSPLDLERKSRRATLKTPQHRHGNSFSKSAPSQSKNQKGGGSGGGKSDNNSRPNSPNQPVKLLFKVMDQGCGIPPESLPVLFEPYTQAKRSITRSHGGTGLGLAIVKKLCDLMHAVIEVESEPNVQTTFSFSAEFMTAPPPSARMAALMRQLPQHGEEVHARYHNYTSLDINQAPGSDTGVDPDQPMDPNSLINGNDPLPAPSPPLETNETPIFIPIHNTPVWSPVSDIAPPKGVRPLLETVSDVAEEPATPLVDNDSGTNKQKFLRVLLSPAHRQSSADQPSEITQLTTVTNDSIIINESNPSNLVPQPITLPTESPKVATVDSPVRDVPPSPQSFDGTGGDPTSSSVPSSNLSSSTTSPAMSVRTMHRILIPRTSPDNSPPSLTTSLSTINATTTSTRTVTAHSSFIELLPGESLLREDQQENTTSTTTSSNVPGAGVALPIQQPLPLHAFSSDLGSGNSRRIAFHRVSSRVPTDSPTNASTSGTPLSTSVTGSPTTPHRTTNIVLRRPSITTHVLSHQTNTSATPPVGIPSNESTATPSPLTSPTSGGVSTPRSAAPLTPRSKLHLLVVDDAAINRRIMHKMLDELYELDDAADGLEALEKVKANPTKYSCVLMDLMMPVMGGTESLMAIRACGFTHLPIIAVTANTMNEDIEKCLSVGFTAFLSKPCRKDILRGKIKELIQVESDRSAHTIELNQSAMTPTDSYGQPSVTTPVLHTRPLSDLSSLTASKQSLT